MGNLCKMSGIKERDEKECPPKIISFNVIGFDDNDNSWYITDFLMNNYVYISFKDDEWMKGNNDFLIACDQLDVLLTGDQIWRIIPTDTGIILFITSTLDFSFEIRYSLVEEAIMHFEVHDYNRSGSSCVAAIDSFFGSTKSYLFFNRRNENF